MTAPNPAEGHRARQFARALANQEAIHFPEIRKLMIEHRERERANEENRRG